MKPLHEGLVSIYRTFLVVNILYCINCQSDKTLKNLAQQYWDWRISQFPEQATVDGFHQYDDKLESYTSKTFDERWNTCFAMKLQGQAINRSALVKEDRLTLDILMDQLSTFIDGHKWFEYGNLNPISFLEGMYLRTNWVEEGLYNTREDFRKYLRRLDQIPTQRGVVKSLRKMATAPVHHSVFYEPFSRKLDETEFPQDEKGNFRSEGIRSIRERVQPAFRRLSHWINLRYMPATRRDYGVWSLENGTRYYESLLRWHLSVDMSPKEVHEIGMREVARVKKAMERLSPWVINSAMDRSTKTVKHHKGYAGDLPVFFQALRQEHKFFDHSEEDLLGKFKQAVYTRIWPRLPILFTNITSIPNITVKRMPYDGIGAQYIKDTLLANTNDPETRPSFTVLALALHEALPGHHLQVSTAKQQDLPDFRRFIMGRKFSAPFHFPYYTAYVEGWALYAEYLGEELGLFNDPYELFGRYCYEIFRACRLVVDTGIHAFSWSRRQAIDYMSNHTFLTRAEIETEVDRYITWPGQACAYKIGELTIKRSRRNAERKLGFRFDIREFHAKVMKLGPAPLRVLETMVEDWVQELNPSSATIVIPCIKMSILSIIISTLLIIGTRL